MKKLLVFDAVIQVPSHGILKNSKEIRMNKKTGARFISSNHIALALKRHLTNELIHKARKESIMGDRYCHNIANPVSIEFKFAYPKDKLITQKDTLNRKCGDLSNLYCLPEDCLQKAGIILDDSMIVSHEGSERVISPDSNYYLSIKIYELINYEIPTLEI